MIDLRKKAKKIFGTYIDANYETIEVLPGKCRYNYKCQMNSVHEAWKHGHDKVALCVAFDGGDPYIHFINFDGEKYVDNTLGQWAREQTYHLIKLIDKSEFNRINAIFTNFAHTIHALMPWYIRWFTESKY